MSFAKIIVSLFCALLLLSGTGKAFAQSYALGPDDEIAVTVFGEPDLSGTMRIGTDGNISMPLIGALPVSGLDPAQAEDLIEKKLAEGYLVKPSVSVTVARYRPFYIMGEVKAPGGYAYAGNMTALNAVALAGGFTYRAKRDKVQILKNGETASPPTDIQTQIAPGDVIVVEERFF